MGEKPQGAKGRRGNPNEREKSERSAPKQSDSTNGERL